ncbi:beta-mannosidase isoform X2 [Bufo bufo]|uniref:beta-mannosidase isoform X2 n=1 Tax=Bufo bufo TaxID=8384 RepID=UPI001ABDCEF7|nr:beta-mannosidase isoform X2 [Bufo bufo]
MEPVRFLLCLGLLQAACGSPRSNHTNVLVFSLTGQWAIRNSNSSVQLQGAVPGCVHTALLNCGIIKDPYIGFNDVIYKWIAQDEWTYSKTFTLPPEIKQSQKVVLVCDAIDTISTVILNTIPIAKTQNMFNRYTVDITQIIKQENSLEIKFQSAVNWAKERSTQHAYDIPPDCPPKVQNGDCHVNFIRKAQCSFSWDWGPSFPTQGIWKDIRIEAYNVVHLNYISYSSVFDNTTSQWMVLIEPVFDTITMNVLPGQVVIRIPQLQIDRSQDLSIVPGQQAYKIIVKINKNTSVDLWWPNGYGLQTGYNMSVTFHFGGEYLIEKSTKVYFRTVELVEEPIEGSPGLSFYIKINGIPIFLKGSNWIPADSFQDRVDSDKLRNLLQSAVDANMNTLRVWGGGIYESDEFYNICDDLGIMVWQDFMFACSLYPTDDCFMETVKEELLHQIRRLKSHPCIIVWSGNNENEAAIASDWFSLPSFMKEVYAKDYRILYIETIRELVLEMDETRPFIASSPSNGKETVKENWISKDPYDDHYGDVHYYNYMTDCWNWTSYPKPRLASEYGFQSWPSFSTIYKVSTRDDWSYSGNFSTHRQHHDSGNEQMMFQAGLHYKMPVMQAQCVKLQTEFYRRSQNEIVDGRGFTMGALYWQLNDIWQAPSWSSIEYGGKWKMLHYYAKDFFAPVAASAFEDQNTLNIYGVSDLLNECSFKLAINVYRWDSLVPVCKRLTNEFILNARSSGVIYKESIAELLSRCGNTTRQHSVIVFYLLHNGHIIGSKNWHFLSSLKEAEGLLKSNITVSISKDDTAYVFTLISSNPVAFVWLDVWDIAGRFSDNGFLLIEEKTVVYFYAWEPTTISNLEKSLHISTIRDIYQQ